MTRITKLFLMTIGIATAIAGSACGSAETSFSPTSPSGIGTPAGAVITGRVSGVTAASTPLGTFGTMDSRSLTVTVVGTGVSTTVNGGGQFTLTGVPSGTVQLRFSGSGVDATVTISGVSASDQIEITVAVNGGSARVESERRGRKEDDDGNAKAEGVVSALSGTCPTLTFTVQSTKVTTSGATAFKDTTCAALANGMRVEVKGDRQADGSIVAARVEADDEDDEDDDHDQGPGRRSEMKGPVASLRGECPNLSFILQGARITTTVATQFADTTCAALRNGVKVEVEGPRQADDSVLATRVELDD